MNKNENMITRRTLLKAGLSAGFATLIPLEGLCFFFSESDLLPIGPCAQGNVPYKHSEVGVLSAEHSKLIADFSLWAIDAWEFEGMHMYPSDLEDVLSLKTNTLPSYLSEYQSAARLIHDAKARLNSEKEAFLYLLFAGRENSNLLETRLGRAQKFVFDELMRHIVANGGFRRFGFINYKGFPSFPFKDPNAYRRSLV